MGRRLTRTILLEADELADAYALRTLYDYLKFNSFEERNDVEIVFDQESSEYHKTVLKDCKFLERDVSSDDLLIRTYSDINRILCADCIDLRIDISILKNCAFFLSSEEKLRLRWKYKLETEKPVLVVGYADVNAENVKELVREVRSLSEVYLLFSNNPFKLAGSHSIKKYGVLRDYYAMADASVNAANLVIDIDVMHNFVEATEGGPLFMVSPDEKYRKQFGYKELSRKKLIRICRSFDDLLNKLTAYLDRPLEEIIEEKREHLGKRANYLMRMRKKYLPDIESVIEKILGEKGNTLNSGLILERNNYLLKHPETDWGVYHD